MRGGPRPGCRRRQTPPAGPTAGPTRTTAALSIPCVAEKYGEPVGNSIRSPRPASKAGALYLEGHTRVTEQAELDIPGAARRGDDDLPARVAQPGQPLRQARIEPHLPHHRQHVCLVGPGTAPAKIACRASKCVFRPAWLCMSGGTGSLPRQLVEIVRVIVPSKSLTTDVSSAAVR